MYNPPPIPPVQPPAPQATRGKRRGPGLIIAGAALLVIWAIVPNFPIPYNMNGQAVHVTLRQLNGLCSSSLGQFGQMFSPQAATGCGHVGLVYDGLAIAFWGGLALIVAGVWRMRRRIAP